MQNFFNNLPNWAKALLLVAIGVTLALGITNLSNFPIPTSKGFVEVKFIVQTEEKEPIENVRVQFIFDGSPEPRFTNSDGYVRIKIPERNDVEVILTKDGFRTLSRIINLSADDDKTRIFILVREISSFDKPIDVQQYTAQNTFFPLVLFLIKPNLKIPAIRRIFLEFLDIDVAPLIDKNEVFGNVEKFRIESGNDKTINRMLDEQLIMSKTTENNFERSSKSDYFFMSPRSLEIRKIDYESNIIESENEFLFSYAPLDIPFKTGFEDINYTSFLDSNYIFQVPKFSDIQKYTTNLKDSWIKKIIENNPKNRGFLAFLYSYILDENDFFWSDDCTEQLWYLDRYTPSPYIKFVDIRNNKKETITIESVRYKNIKKDFYDLTVVDQRNSLFQSKNAFDTEKELNINLRKDQHFLIPIEFGFNTESLKPEILNLEKQKLFNINEIYVSRPLNKVDKQNINQKKYQKLKPIEKVKLSNEFIKSSSALDEVFDLIPKRFAVGSILNVKSIKINGQDIKIPAPSDEPTVYISSFLQAGSCPYLLVYNEKKWIEIRTILTNIKDQSLQHDEVYEFDNTISKIKIEEREPEITYFDSLSILYTAPDTAEEKEITYPLPELEKIDGKYFLLHQGESFEIDLKNFIPANAINVKLKVNGYYKRTELIN